MLPRGFPDHEKRPIAYFDKISNSPDNLVFIDFWGRVTVYSLWFMCYEVYRKYLQEDAPQAAPSANRGFVARVRTT